MRLVDVGYFESLLQRGPSEIGKDINVSTECITNTLYEYNKACFGGRREPHCSTTTDR